MNASGNYMNLGMSSARNAMQNFIITTSEKLKKTEDYKKVTQIVYRLMEGGVTFAAKGYCISMSDIIYTLLKQNNIPCKIVECQLSITNKQNEQIYVVGFNGLKDDTDRTDTHVVVVTETEVPMVIDVSIAHLLPNNIQGVIDELSDNDSDIFANIHSQYADLTYQEKKTYNIPLLHQTSIVDRIKTDMTIFKSLNRLKYFLVVALVVSSLNAIRGTIDFYLVYFSENFWGPKTTEEMYIRLENIDKKLQQLESIELSKK